MFPCAVFPRTTVNETVKSRRRRVFTLSTSFFYSMWYYVCRRSVLLWLLAEWSAQSISGCTTVLSSRPGCPHAGPAVPLLWSTTAILGPPSPPLGPVLLAWRTEGRGLVSTSSARSSSTVINTSSDSVLCMNNNIPVWLVGLCGGSAVSGFHCCQLLFLVESQNHWKTW